MLGPQAPAVPPRFSASMLPVDADPAERDFVRLLERALSPSFTLVRRLGAGGMGSVYLARDPVLKRLVAVKVMAPALAADPQARARFEREAQTVASITHPNVVAVYSVGTLENGVPFLVMQYVEGKTMAERIAEGGPLDAPTAKRVLGEVAGALAAAHRKGVIHRDIKPGNILWDDETGRALVTDFGIAAVRQQSAERPAAEKITRTGMAIGTPAYMSPEQVLGEPVTDRTDVYSLGVLGYEMLIGEGPYLIAKPGEAMAAHLRDTPRRLSSLRADVDPEVERLLEDCLSKDPERRPTAAEAEDRITHGAGILLEWPPPGLEHLTARFARALKPTALGGALVGVPLVLLSVFERGTYVRSLLPPVEFILAVVTLGCIVFAWGCVQLYAFLSAAGRSVEMGYHWGTVFEVVADRRGDTGALITGAREYATLAPALRSRLRRHRVAGTLLLLAAALTPIVGYAAGVLLTARVPSGPTVVLWSSLALPLSCTAAWWLLGLYEGRLLRAARSRRLALSSVRERPSELAAAWTQAFNQVRLGQGMGPGPAGRRVRVMRIAVGAVALAAVAAMLGNFLILVTTVAGVFDEGRAARYSAAALQRIDGVRRLAAYTVPPDSSITPIRAGQALHAAAGSLGSRTSGKWESPPAISIPPFTFPPEPPPFGDSSSIADAFRVARRGFTDEQRRWLRRVAENPALAEFRLAANAPRADLSGAIWSIPPGSRLSLNDVPEPPVAGIRAAGFSNIASAALDLAAGQTREAERRLREVVSIGFLLVRDGFTLTENLTGAIIVNSARQSLQAFFEATGRPADARFVSATADPTHDGRIDPYQLSRLPADEAQAMLARVILDTGAVRGLRWEMLINFSFGPCRDARQMVFGPDEAHRAMMDSARVSLVRSGSDSLVFSLLEQPLNDRHMVREGRSLARLPFTFTGWLATQLTGHNVIASCAAIIGLK